MRIITQGALPENKVYQTTCQRCTTTYEFFAHEARFVSDQREGDAYVAKCPLTGCDHENWVSARRNSQWDR